MVLRCEKMGIKYSQGAFDFNNATWDDAHDATGIVGSIQRACVIGARVWRFTGMTMLWD